MLAQRLGLPSLRGAVGYVAAVLVDALGSGLFLPLSLLYFQSVAALPLAAVGLTLTVATFLTLPVTPVTGIFVDVFGARRMTVISQLLQATGFVGYLAVRTIPALVATTVLITVGTRMFYTANTTFVAEIAVPDERDRWYGLVAGLRSAGIGVGGIVAGLMIAVGSRAGYQALVALNAASFLVAAMLLLRVRTTPGPRRAAALSPPRYGQVLRDWPFLGFAMSNLVLVICSMVTATALPVFVLEALDAPRWTVGAVFSFTTIFAVVGQTVVVRLVERYRRTRVLMAAGIVRGASSALFALALLVPRGILVPYLFMVTTLFMFGGCRRRRCGDTTGSAPSAPSPPPRSRGRIAPTGKAEYRWAGSIGSGGATSGADPRMARACMDDRRG